MTRLAELDRASPAGAANLAKVATLSWLEAGRDRKRPALRLLDQTRLPGEVVHLECTDVEMVAESIEILRVRGAPAIGVAAAYGIALAAATAAADGDFEQQLENAFSRLARTRPTAVNLFWALGIMRREFANSGSLSRAELVDRLIATANELCRWDREVCHRIGQHGAELLTDGARVLTHCNAGGLATAGYGTALGVIYGALEQNKRVSVFADETRPLLQGARLTSWELLQNGIDVTVICDSMAATVLRGESIDCVIVGADRIAANGDVANKIGTYGVAVLAREHGVPFYVAAPMSTVDLSLDSGAEIPIEQRSAEEVAVVGGGRSSGARTVPDGVKVYNPAFDVTPHHLVDAIITEFGVARGPYGDALGDWQTEHASELAQL